MILQESKELSTFKILLNVLEDYAMAFPLSSFSQYLEKALEHGKKIIPTDKQAKEILSFVLTMGAAPEVLQFLTGRRFSSLPTVLKPTYKEGNRVQVAYWTKGEITSDMIKSLLNTDGKSGGFWSDASGKKISLLTD